MSNFENAQERLESAIGHLERALDARVRADRALREEADSLKASNETVSKRLDAAIERLQGILGD